VACSVLVWASPEAGVEVDAAFGACAGDLRAFTRLALCAARAFVVRLCDVEALPLVPAPVVVIVCVLPGKAWAASAQNVPVSVTVPASNQRLQRASRRTAAFRE
jgi:hypothetical protein